MVTGQDIANFAKKCTGREASKWIDDMIYNSSGFMAFCYKKVAGINLPHGTKNLLNQGTKVSRKQLKPGDLVFPHAGHVGISIGEEKFIHAPQTYDIVKEAKVATINKFLTARRIL